MAPPLPAAPKRTRPRRLNLPLLSSSSVAMNMSAQARMAAEPQAASPSLAPAPQATPGSIPPTATWLPPAFVPNSSSPMVHSSDLNATDAAIQEGWYSIICHVQEGVRKLKKKNVVGKEKDSSSTMDEIDKLREVQAKSKEDQIDVLERHQQIAAAKKESARLNHLAAQEKKEAKLLEKEGKMHDKESKLLETYKSLLTFDTSQMSEDLRAEHMIAVKTMRERIFATRAS
nr:unnamed protein product [Digitaria exilis]